MKFYFSYYMYAHMEKVEFPAMASGTQLAHLMVNLNLSHTLPPI